jgi:hypothetical protein
MRAGAAGEERRADDHHDEAHEVVGDDEGEVGARDEREHDHLGLAARGEGEEGLERGREARERHRLGEDERDDAEQEAEGEARRDVAAQLGQGDAGVGRADAEADEELRGEDRLGRGADLDDAGEAEGGGEDERAEDRRAEEADARRRPPAGEARGDQQRAWESGVSAAGRPGASVSGTPQMPVMRMGASETMVSTRVAWISDRVRGLPPASWPKISMSWRPPGIAE